MAVEDEVRQASEQFYAALNSMLNGDTRADDGGLVTRLRRVRHAPLW